MGRSALVVSIALAIVGFCAAGYCQTPIATFDDIAGTWAGHTSPHNHSVTLEIDARGRFKARSPLGREIGEARLQGGALVIPLSEHQGSLQLVFDGDTLKGPGVINGRTWIVRLVRTDPAAKAEWGGWRRP